MNNWSDTTVVSDEERTSSESIGAYEGEFVAVSDLDVDEKVEFDELVEYTVLAKSQKYSLETPKVRAFDVAAYILQKMGTMTTMKLQKLVYYSQAWSLVWDEKRLFEEDVEAWANGPVVRALFNFHRGMYEIASVPIGNPNLLNQDQRDSVDAVLKYYGDKPSQWLIELTHMEDPWRDARKGLPKLERGSRVIPLGAMADYYSSLLAEEDSEDEG